MKRDGKKQISIQLRKKILDFALRTEKAHVHIGSCLSCIDILIETLVFQMKSKDRFILSKGHASLALYVVFNYLKKISDKELSTYFEEGTHFGIHTPSTMPDLIPLATGSLGHGLSFAAGAALGYKMQDKKNPRHVYCLISDGECNEGAVWEAAQFATAKHIDNLTVIIDKNAVQALGKTKEVLGDGASVAKWRSFGFNVKVASGHSFTQLNGAFSELRKMSNGRPNMIIARTIRGRGIKSIENKVVSNYTAVDKALYDKAVLNLKK